MRLGLDVGSTTLKCVILDDFDNVIYKEYERHFSEISSKAAEMISRASEHFSPDTKVDFCLSGSAGMGLAESLALPFVQEVYATRSAVNRFLPGTDTVIELGGEDAKILFLSGEDGEQGLEVRMNGSCAGGTGAFIDQMATLLNMTPDEMNEQSKNYEKIYTIASRCGVFAKSDIQPLLNQGARKSDVSASIFAAVVNQTIAGLAQGREIKGNVVYLGGPMTFLSELRRAFNSILKVDGICPENSLYFVAVGAAISPSAKAYTLQQLIAMFTGYRASDHYRSCRPLFESAAEYEVFCKRHAADAVENAAELQTGDVYLGIDAGSTTVKAAVIDSDNRLVCSVYLPNSGNPVPLVRDFLTDFYRQYPGLHIVSAAVTGYGEDIIKNAFHVDYGIVETMAHFGAARYFRPDVDFIIDIGGQDIKCFKIANGAIDNIFLNEACSSGCGSFLQTFAGALGYSIAEFAKLGVSADRPVDLGSRCTVFMNSSVKQAQKDGASIENISAGLSISVVKNALYKVIRAVNADSLGQHIVVQGGTFLNDAVLRAFEQEIGREVIRPSIAGLMGAFGAALYAKKKRAKGDSSLLTLKQLEEFSHKVTVVTCNSCSNHCRLTVNTFHDGSRFIGGNRCEKPVTGGKLNDLPNLYDYKRSLLAAYQPVPGPRGKIGIPMGLNMFELLPFWHALFTKLGFEVVTSPPSNRKLYLSGQNTIPSDTVCFPAKLIHGHVEALLKEGIHTIFYPCMSYNFDEYKGDNHYNCPVVAYYPEVIAANNPELANITFIRDYIGIHRPHDFEKHFFLILSKYFPEINRAEVRDAVRAAYREYDNYMQKIRVRGQQALDECAQKKIPVIILCGRPYHLDSEVNHGIDKLINACGAAVISEDAVAYKTDKFPTTVLNQWTYHSRLYSAARYVADLQDRRINLVQLVSFGCGVDAITTDEVRSILEGKNRIYTQIKIDEITNLGAVKIRLRSLFSALEQEEAMEQ